MPLALLPAATLAPGRIHQRRAAKAAAAAPRSRRCPRIAAVTRVSRTGAPSTGLEPLTCRAPQRTHASTRRVALRASAAGVAGGSAEWQALQGQTVVSVATGEEQQLTDLIGTTGQQRCVLAFLTQFGDFDSMEMVQVRVPAHLRRSSRGVCGA